MPAHAKQAPDKCCQHCGKIFNRKRIGKRNDLECYSNYMRRKFCSLSCSASFQHANPAPSWEASRKRTMKNVGSFCECCGYAENLVVHHVDGNPMNPSPENLQTLCSPCHSYWHAMLRRIGRKPSTPMPQLVERQCSEVQETPSCLKSRQSS